MQTQRRLALSACGVLVALACRSRSQDAPAGASLAGSGGQSFAGALGLGGASGASGTGGTNVASGGAVGGAALGGAGSGGSPPVSFAPVLAVGPFSACLVATDRSVKCAGRCGPSGHGGSRDVAPPAVRAGSVVLGREFACAALVASGTTGIIQCWGAGPGAEPPVLTDSAELVAGDQHACSRDATGVVTCWGDPAQLAPAGIVAKRLAASGAMTCAITRDDSIRCWGPHVAEPPADLKARQLSLSSQLTDAAHGPRFGCAVTLAGNVRCFGDNVGGVQTPPPGLLAKQVALGRSNACAIAQDDTVVCWGQTVRGGALPPPGLKAQALSLSFRGSGALTLDGKAVFWDDVGDGWEGL